MYHAPINCSNRVDASQVAWKSKCIKEHNALFPNNYKTNHDAYFFDQLYKKCGPSHYTGVTGQFKGRHRYQLGNIKYERALNMNDINPTTPLQ